MKLDPDRGPHGFICPKCGGCVEITPPATSAWEWQKCGTFYNGVRCGKRIPRRSIVCEGCERVIAEQVARRREGSEFLIRVMGGLPAQRQIDTQRSLNRAAERFAAETVKREKLEAKRKLREAEIGYVVYYARLGLNHIKIGTSNDLRRRMRELRVVNESNLLAAEPGGYATETKRHTQFKKWRYNRRKEDFGEGPDLLKHIEATRTAHGDPYQLAARLAAESEAA
jgi:hypothetical protein